MIRWRLKIMVGCQSKKVRTKCAASMRTDRCLRLSVLLISSPCCPKVILSILGACRQFRPRGQPHTMHGNTNRHLPGCCALSFSLAHSLSCIHKHSPPHRGHFIAAQSGRKQLTGLQNRVCGYSGTPEMKETNKMADH